MEDTENTQPIVAATAKPPLSFVGKQPILQLARKVLKEKNATFEGSLNQNRNEGIYRFKILVTLCMCVIATIIWCLKLAKVAILKENGNLCERGQGSPIEAVAAKSFNEDPVGTPPKPEAPAATEKSHNSAEEDQSQALTDTNSASFVSLNTLSASEAVFNFATGDHSRPISADTDSLDYESADEAVSLKSEDQQEKGVELNESLGLDALTNKLSNLYLNSPHASKKAPAFHSEDTPIAQLLLDESESDISFSASLGEVVKLTNQTEDPSEVSPCSVELIVEEVSEPEELGEPEKQQQSFEPEEKQETPELEEQHLAFEPEKKHELVEPEEKQELTVDAAEGQCPTEPGENKTEEAGQADHLELENQVLLAEPEIVTESQEEKVSAQEPELENRVLPAEPEIVAQEEEVSQLVPQEKVESLTEKQIETESQVEESVTSDELNTVLVASEDIPCATVPELLVTLSSFDQASAENLSKDLEPSITQTDPAEEVLQTTDQAEVQTLLDHSVSETQQESLAAAIEAPQVEAVEETLVALVTQVVEEETAKLASVEQAKQQAVGTPENLPAELCIPEADAIVEAPAKEETKYLEPVVEPAAVEPLDPEPVKELEESNSTEVLLEPDLLAEPEKCTPLQAQTEVTESEPAILNSEEVQAEQPIVEVVSEVLKKPGKVEEFIGEVSFEEPNLINLNSGQATLSGALLEEFAKEQITSSGFHIAEQDQINKLDLLKEFDQPEKEVSEEKPVAERKIAPATLFIHENKSVEILKKDPLITSTSSLSELLNLCEQQQRNLEDEVDTRVVEETNELEELLAADANLICEELNASLDNIGAEMSDNEAPVTPPRRSRSPRKPSPGRNVDLEDDPFKSKARVGISPARETMTSSAESVLVSSRMSMSKSTDSASVKLMRSMDSGIAGAEMNHSEAGPDIASQDEQFVPATEELFKDPSAFDFLSKFGGNDSAASRLERESLYVKFDPLVGNRDRKVFLSPCIEASPRSEDITETPIAASKMAAKSDTPLTSRHAVGPLVQIATPVQDTNQQAAQPKTASKDKESQQKEAEMEALQQMIVLHKKESEELKKLMTSQIEDYEQTIASLQGKLKQKTEAEEQMSLVMKEYEDTISRILAEKEKAMEKSQEEKQKLTDELAIIQSDLSAAEVAFSDLHRKYERAKSAIEVFKSNENTLKQSNLQFQEQIKQAEKKYLVLKTHAEDKLEQAAKENEALVKSSELEISALKAQNAQLKARNNTLVETLGMRERENQELVTICDDLVKKLGPH